MKKNLKTFAAAFALILVFSVQSYGQNKNDVGKSFYTREEVKRMCGVPVDPEEMTKVLAKQDSMYKEYIRKKQSSGRGLSKIETIPNWKAMMSDVENQGDCWDCWVHAATGIAEGQLHILYGSKIGNGVDLDELEISGACNGGFPTWAEETIKTSKMRSEVGSYPNLSGVRWTILQYSTTSGIDEIKSALVNGPVTACFYVYADFSPFFAGNPQGVYHYDGYSEFLGGHAVVIVSYDDGGQYWLCKNSWGSGWADGGYFRIGYGQCGIESWENSVVTVNQSCYAKIVPNLISSISTAFGYGFVNSEWAYVLGSSSVTSNLTVPSGSTLQINSGSTLSFSSGTKLTVNGSLIASSATFQGSGYWGSWFGIELYGNQSIASCTIKDAEYGLKFYNSYNSYWYNQIKNNTYGIHCSNYGDPTFVTTVLQTNGYGVWGDNTAVPSFGVSPSSLATIASVRMTTMIFTLPTQVPSTLAATIGVHVRHLPESLRMLITQDGSATIPIPES